MVPLGQPRELRRPLGGALRPLACLGAGALLWGAFGAVDGASYWQISAERYLVGLTLAGAVFGLAWPTGHLRTGALLVAPGAGWLAARSLSDQPDLFWWWLSVVVGMYTAGGSHWLLAEVRRWHPTTGRVHSTSGRWHPIGRRARRPGLGPGRMS